MQFRWVPTTHAFIKKWTKNYIRCNLKTTELLECALKGVQAVISSNMHMVCYHGEIWNVHFHMVSSCIFHVCKMFEMPLINLSQVPVLNARHV